MMRPLPSVNDTCYVFRNCAIEQVTVKAIEEYEGTDLFNVEFADGTQSIYFPDGLFATFEDISTIDRNF